MSQVTIDAGLIQKLTVHQDSVELVDENGRVVGRFTPIPDVSEFELSEEETRRRLADGRKRYTTDEVLAYLRNLP